MPNALTIVHDTGLATPAGTINPELLKRFMRYVGSESERTQKTYLEAIKLFLGWMADQGITQPVPDDIYSYREWLKTDPIHTGPHKGRTRKPSTVQTYITVLKIFFRWLSIEGIYRDITNGMKGVKLGREHKKDPFTGDQVKMILAKMPRNSVTDKRNLAIMLLLFTGALRTIEVSRARIEDLHSIGGKTFLNVQGKGYSDTSRKIHVLPETEKAIREYLALRGSYAPHDPLFVTHAREAGKALSTRTLSKIAKDSFIQAGFNSERWTAHSTRHTGITLASMDKENNTILDVQSFAGHAQTDTTAIYIHSIDRLNSTCEEAIGRAIFGR